MNEGRHREDEDAAKHCVHTEEVEHQEARHRNIGVVHNADVQTHDLHPYAAHHELRDNTMHEESVK